MKVLTQVDAALVKMASLCLDASKLDARQLEVKPTLGTPIDVLALSTRCYNVLHQAHATTGEAVCKLTAAELGRVRNCGEKTIAEIKRALSMRGLSLTNEQL